MNGKYVQCSPKKKWKGMGLHSKQLQKVLMNPEKTGRSINVDHKDGNENNYQKDNLRVCTHAQNMQNRKPHRTYGKQETTSKYRGVRWNKKDKAWRVNIQANGIYYELGKFSDETSAANCYNYHAKELHGEFTKLNDVPYMSKDEWEKNKLEFIFTSKYRGVSFIDGRWVAQIYHDGKNIRLGSYVNEEDAAIAYDKVVKELKDQYTKSGTLRKLNILNW